MHWILVVQAGTLWQSLSVRHELGQEGLHLPGLEEEAPMQLGALRGQSRRSRQPVMHTLFSQTLPKAQSTSRVQGGGGSTQRLFVHLVRLPQVDSLQSVSVLQLEGQGGAVQRRLVHCLRSPQAVRLQSLLLRQEEGQMVWGSTQAPPRQVSFLPQAGMLHWVLLEQRDGQLWGGVSQVLRVLQ